MTRRIGDRKDGVLLRDIDSMHFITPIIYPNRCDNEAFISEVIDLTALNAYLEKKNFEGITYQYNLFQALVTAMMRVITQMPKLNRFIVNGDTFQRNERSASFVVKKEFALNGGEALAFLKIQDEDNIDTIHEKIYQQVKDLRGDKVDSSTESMDIFNKLPRKLSKFLIRIVCFLDKHGKVPQSLIDSDPYYSSVIFTNLGSIKLHSGYHHLTNWGTNSVFMAIGEKTERPFFKDGEYEMKDSIDLGLTIDERLADGYYYSVAVRMLKKLLENPELLEEEMSVRVEV